jgi:hypothetical protein
MPIDNSREALERRAEFHMVELTKMLFQLDTLHDIQQVTNSFGHAKLLKGDDNECVKFTSPWVARSLKALR